MGILSYLVPIIILIVILKILALPLKIIKAIIINSIIGGLILFALSLLGIVIALAWWGYVLTGLFGVPGLIIAIILTKIL